MHSLVSALLFLDYLEGLRSLTLANLQRTQQLFCVVSLFSFSLSITGNIFQAVLATRGPCFL